MIGRNSNMGCALLNHGQDRGEHAARGSDLLPTRVLGRWQRKEMPKEFVGAVNEMDVHWICLPFQMRTHPQELCVAAALVISNPADAFLALGLHPYLLDKCVLMGNPRRCKNKFI